MSLPPSEIPQGAIRFNTDSQKLEFYAQGEWWVMSTNPATPVAPRGLFMGGFQDSPTPNLLFDIIDYVNITTTGDAVDFGDMLGTTFYGTACASSTRGLYMNGAYPATPSTNNTIQYVTIATTGNSIDFGDTVTIQSYSPAGVSDETRGIKAGGATNPATGPVNNIEFVTIASTGNAADFGDLIQSARYMSGCSSPTRGIFCHGSTGANPAPAVNTISYVTIQSEGNSIDFGDTTSARSSTAAFSSSVRGVFSGGATVNIIDFITIATTGNAQDFGDLTVARANLGGFSSPTRGVTGGGGSGAMDNTIDYVSIQTLGNATNFGDLTQARSYARGCSNAHGGL